MEFREAKVLNASIFSIHTIDTIIANVESVVINQLEHGDRAGAMKRLRVPPLEEQQSPWTTFRLGFFVGCFIILLMIIVAFMVGYFRDFNRKNIFYFQVGGVYNIGRPPEPKWVGVRLFRGFLILFVNVWLLGLNVYGWQRAGVNHVLIFEIDPRNHLTYQQLMEIASFLCMLWALCVLGYVKKFGVWNFLG